MERGKRGSDCAQTQSIGGQNFKCANIVDECVTLEDMFRSSPRSSQIREFAQLVDRLRMLSLLQECKTVVDGSRRFPAATLELVRRLSNEAGALIERMAE